MIFTCTGTRNQFALMSAAAISQASCGYSRLHCDPRFFFVPATASSNRTTQKPQQVSFWGFAATLALEMQVPDDEIECEGTSATATSTAAGSHVRQHCVFVFADDPEFIRATFVLIFDFGESGSRSLQPPELGVTPCSFQRHQTPQTVVGAAMTLALRPLNPARVSMRGPIATTRTRSSPPYRKHGH